MVKRAKRTNERTNERLVSGEASWPSTVCVCVWVCWCGWCSGRNVYLSGGGFFFFFWPLAVLLQGLIQSQPRRGLSVERKTKRHTERESERSGGRNLKRGAEQAGWGGFPVQDWSWNVSKSDKIAELDIMMISTFFPLEFGLGERAP